jgi:hypothetical protein
MTDREAFLAGDRPDAVLVYLSEAVLGNPGALAGVGEPVADGVVLVVPGTEGRQALQSAVDVDPMAFAQAAMGTDGEVEADCTGGTCPAAAGDPDGHDVQFVFAFAEGETPEAGGRYAEGDVVHAYAQCACGEQYADRWVAGTRD